MQRYHIVASFVIMLLLSSIVPMVGISAETESEYQVEATFTCQFNSATQLTVQAKMIVNRINVFDTTYDKQAIEIIASTNQYVMGAIMLRLRDSAKTLVQTAFKDATVKPLSTTPVYERPYFTDTFKVNLTTGFFRHDGALNISAFVSGVLDMGAIVKYRFDLQAPLGWNTTYVYLLPPTMLLESANTAETTPEVNSASWVLRNWAGGSAVKDARLEIRAKNPTTSSAKTEDIELEFIVDAQTGSATSLITSIVVRTMNVSSYEVVPDFVTGLVFLPSDGIRLFVDNALLSWDLLFEKTIQPIEQKVTPLLENSSFNQALNFSFAWDSESSINCSSPYNITNMDDVPAIRALFTDHSVDLQICEMPARAFFGLMNAGASATIASNDMNFGLGLEKIMYPFLMQLRLPHNISFKGENVYVWNRTAPLNDGTFSSTLQPSPAYNNENIETRIEIELLKMDLNIPYVLTGRTELSTVVIVRKDVHIHVLRRPDVFALHPKITSSYLNSDALRLCIEEKVFTDDQITLFLSEKTGDFQQLVSEIIDGASVTGVVDRKAFFDSLVWDGDISSMDAVIPVVVSNSATEVYKIAFNASLWPAELSLTPQQFMLQGMENQTVTYRFVFPRGVSVNASDSAGRPIIKGKTSEGNEYVELSFNSQAQVEETLLTCVLTASPVYVLGLFFPCLLVFVLLLVLAVVLYLIRKKKGGFKRRRKEKPSYAAEQEIDSDDEPTEYAEQDDYYVPPPPRKKRRRR